MTKEQTEQKADEYAKKISKGIYFEKGSYTEVCLEQGRLGFINGYRECQKEHEWHWTKKEGFPKDNKAYLTLMSYGIRGTKYEVRENLKDEQPYNLVKWKEIE